MSRDLAEIIKATTGATDIASAWKQWAADNGATLTGRVDAVNQVLTAAGYTGSIQDKWNSYLADAGYTGDLTQKMRDFWLAGGSAGGTEFFGVVSFVGTNNSTSARRFGWRFTVGPDDLLCNTLRLITPTNSATEKVIVHRWSDQVVMTQAEITPSAGTWVNATVAEFTLVSGVQYIVSTNTLTGASRTHYRLGVEEIFAGVIHTSAETYFTGSVDGMPTTVDTSEDYYACDFGYVAA